MSAATLTVSGIAGAYFSTRNNKRFLALNMMAFFYALQQFAEGMIWIHSPIFSAHLWGILFLFFALFVYPWYAGFSCYVISRQFIVKRKILWIMILGFLFGAWAFSNVIITPDLGLNQCRLHIFYDIQILGGYKIDGVFMHFLLIPLYVFFTSAPFFICDKHYASWVGWAILLSAIICWIIYIDYFISVWCFYAAFISCAITLATYLSGRIKKRVGISTEKA